MKIYDEVLIISIVMILFFNQFLAIIVINNLLINILINYTWYSDIVVNLIGKYYETKHVVPTRREDGSLSRVNYSYEVN